MTDFKRRSSNAIPLKKAASPSVSKLQLDQLREKLQKSIIDNPQTAKKAALLIGMWIEGRSKQKKKAA